VLSDGKWQMANGKWQMANGKWQMAKGSLFIPALLTRRLFLCTILTVSWMSF
jgi:hypothetical protein